MPLHPPALIHPSTHSSSHHPHTHHSFTHSSIVQPHPFLHSLAISAHTHLSVIPVSTQRRQMCARDSKINKPRGTGPQEPSKGGGGSDTLMYIYIYGNETNVIKKLIRVLLVSR